MGKPKPKPSKVPQTDNQADIFSTPKESPSQLLVVLTRDENLEASIQKEGIKVIGKEKGKIGEDKEKKRAGERKRKDRERDKENRTDRSEEEGEYSESERNASDGSYLSNKKICMGKPGMGEKEIETDKDIVPTDTDVAEIKENEGEEENCEKELLDLVKELTQVINKARNTTREVTVALRRHGEPGQVEAARGRTVQSERHLRLAAALARQLDLLTANIKLREEINWRSMGTQCSPSYLKMMDEGARKARENVRNKQKRKEKKKDKGEYTKTDETKEGGSEMIANKEGIGSRTEREEDTDTNIEEVEEWKIVERKKRLEDKKKARENRKKIREEEEVKKREEEVIKKARKIPQPPKSEAIIVKTSKERSFADLFKQLKTEAADKMKGIQMVRRSRGGDLIIELEKDSNALTMEQAIRDTLGKEFPVRKLSPKVAMEIKDLDPTMEREEVGKAIAERLDLGEMAESEIEVRTMKFGYGGTKTAILAVPADLAEKLGKESKIKIGFTNCRINRTANVIRCYRCHDLGHMSYECREKLNGNELCRRCGVEGHQINGCQATRCCTLCVKKGIPAANAEHVAGAVNCPQFKKFIAEINRRTS